MELDFSAFGADVRRNPCKERVQPVGALGGGIRPFRRNNTVEPHFRFGLFAADMGDDLADRLRDFLRRINRAVRACAKIFSPRHDEYDLRLYAL